MTTAPKPQQTMLEQYQDRCIAYQQEIANLRAALGGAMFFVPIGTKARERGDAAMNATA